MAFVITGLIIIVMLVLNGIFAAYEMALASVSRVRIHGLFAKKVKGADDAVFMKDHMEASLAVVQLGLTFVGAIAAATGGLSAADTISPYLVSYWHVPTILADTLAVVFFVVPLSGVMIIFAELVPKMIALNNRERVFLAMSPAMRKLFNFLYPVVMLFEGMVKRIVAVGGKRLGVAAGGEDPGLHELLVAAALARTSRLIGAHQEKIVMAAAQLSTRPVKEIILPIVDVCTIPLSATLSQALIRAHMDMHTRFPVCARENDPQSIEGYVTFKDIIAALRLNPSDPSVRGIVRPIKVIEGETSISHALEVMIQEKLHISLVSGRAGGFIGIVTLEDIIEELVGDIEDEFDRMPNHIHAFAGGWIMGGGVPMSTVAQTTAKEIVLKDPNERLCDWCARQAPEGVRSLTGGEILEAGALRVTIRKFRRHKVSEVAVAVV
jgi:putative hemolysin